jgi:hypothetical protein
MSIVAIIARGSKSRLEEPNVRAAGAGVRAGAAHARSVGGAVCLDAASAGQHGAPPGITPSTDHQSDARAVGGVVCDGERSMVPLVKAVGAAPAGCSISGRDRKNASGVFVRSSATQTHDPVDGRLAIACRATVFRCACATSLTAAHPVGVPGAARRFSDRRSGQDARRMNATIEEILRRTRQYA